MSERRARTSRRSASASSASNGSALEKLPDLDAILGLDEKAELDAGRIKNLARMAHTIKRIALLEEKKDTDAIPNSAPEEDGAVVIDGESFRSFCQQRGLLDKSLELLWEDVRKAGHLASLARILDLDGIEKVPSLDDLLSPDEKAQLDAERIKNLARMMHEVRRIKLLEEKKDTDAIPNSAPEADGAVPINGLRFRSFRQQRGLLNKSLKLLWDAIEEEGYRANIERILEAGRAPQA